VIIREEYRIIFVRFCWLPTQYLSIRDIIGRYRRDIDRIVRMLLTGVMAWEFRLFGPGDIWQIFPFTHDGLTEIREDGTIFYRSILLVPADESIGSPLGNGTSGEGNGYDPGDDP
jgi:hypothetical protein